MDFTAEHRKLVQTLVAGVLRRPWSDPDVEDCTSETFRRALESQNRLRSGEPVRPWLLGIARHVALDSLRAHYRTRERTVASAGGHGDERDLVSLIVDARPNPEAVVGGRKDAELLLTHLNALPEEQRQVMILFHVEGLGYREIADELKVPIGSVGTWILRARNSLRESLREALGEKSLGGNS